MDGVMLVHSHPSSDTEHTHSKTDFFFIHQLSSIETLKAGFQYIEPVKFPLLYILDGSRTIAFPKNKYIRFFQLRAPPCC